MVKRACLVLAVSIACGNIMADTREPEQADTTNGGWLDVTADGRRYYGIYLYGTRDDRVVWCSGIKLTPWNERHGSVEYSNGRTTFKIGEFAIVCPPGQPLLLANSDKNVSFVAYDVPGVLKNCRSREEMQKQVRSLLEAHMSRQPSLDP